MLITTKLFVPTPQTELVRRQVLLQRLNESWQLGQRFWLFSAPAGYGKTSLLADWLQWSGVQHAWVSLDADDNDPARFFTYLIHALEPHCAGLSTALLPALNVPQNPALDGLLAEVINRVAQNSQPVCLALDDYHLIHHRQVHALLQNLLEHLPPQLRLAVLTREDPPLPLARLRARQQMIEIRERDLSFSLEETTDLLLNSLKLALGTEQVQALAERTEGWAAGLQLAGISLRGSAAPDELIQSFSGSHRYIIDYLAAEVLANQPDGLREFLCQTAMLDRFCADLCDQALGRSDSRTLLQRAETSNPFLVALDEQRHWYRYHHLLADVLQLEVEPALQAQIQQRAAVWFEQEGNFSEAVKYALRAKDYALSCNLIRKAAVPAAEQGMLATALGWLELLPEAVLLEATDLAILRAWFLVYNGRIPETIAWVARLEGLQTAHLPEDQQGMLLVLRSWLYMASGGQIDLDGLLRAQTMLGSAQPHFRPIVLLALGQAYESRGNTPAAMQCFEEAERLARQAGSLVTALILRNNLAFLLGRCGRRAEAAELYQEAIDEQTLPDGRPSLLAGIPMLVKGCMLYEDGNTEAAYPVLNQGLNLIRRLGMYDILASPVNYVLALLLQDEGRYEEAIKRTREIRRQAQRAGFQAIAMNAEITEMELELRAGHLEAVARWAARQKLPEPQVDEAIFGHTGGLLARFYLASGQLALAARLLNGLAEGALRSNCLMALASLRIEQADCAQRQGDEVQAVQYLQEALRLAAPQGYRQVFRRALPRIDALLRRCRSTAPEFVAAILGEGQAVASSAAAAELVEVPGERELEILRLVAAGLNNQDIANQLYITVGTVKWHLNNLFGKLGVKNRTQAVAQARALGLL